MKLIKLIKVMLIVILLSGCAQIVEVCKVFWGSSTRALEEARQDALKSSYQCSFDACFDAVVKLSGTEHVEDTQSLFNKDEDEKNEEDRKPIERPSFFEIFINNRKKGYLVIMGLPGSIDTTEVGIFFTPQEDNTTKIEVSSLSRNAKQKAAELIFTHLDGQFSKVNQ